MNEIKLKCDSGEYLSFYIDSDFFKYGKSEIEIKVSRYFVRGHVWFSSGELKRFTEELKQMYESMKGIVVLSDSECNVDIEFSFNTRGYVNIKGCYKENYEKDNELIFELETTQPSLEEWIRRFQIILAG